MLVRRDAVADRLASTPRSSSTRETDLSCLTDAGRRILTVPSAEAIHHEQLTGRPGAGGRWSSSIVSRYMQKHHTSPVAWLSRALWPGPTASGPGRDRAAGPRPALVSAPRRQALDPGRRGRARRRRRSTAPRPRSRRSVAVVSDCSQASLKRLLGVKIGIECPCRSSSLHRRATRLAPLLAVRGCGRSRPRGHKVVDLSSKWIRSRTSSKSPNIADVACPRSPAPARKQPGSAGCRSTSRIELKCLDVAAVVGIRTPEARVLLDILAHLSQPPELATARCARL
jgi:hypothetical protein